MGAPRGTTHNSRLPRRSHPPSRPDWPRAFTASLLPSLLLCWQAWNLCPPAPLTVTAESPQRDAGPEDALEDEPQDDLQEEFLGALGALGGSAGNGRLREVLEWEEATFDGVKAQLLSRGLIVPGRGRGGSVVLAAGRVVPAPEAPAGPVQARRSRAGKASGATTASAFDQAFRAIDDCLRKEAGCGTSRAEVLVVLREHFPGLAAEFKLSSLQLFGSFATDEATASSRLLGLISWICW
jgi:hypothetical protein